MIRNYVLTLLRNLSRDMSFVAINIGGLALGMACCVIMGLYLVHELGYDRHYPGHENIYRVVGARELNDSSVSARVHYTVGPNLVRDFNELKAQVSFTPVGYSMYHSDDASLSWDNVYTADANVFDVFTHEIIAGDPATALLRPGTIAVSESFANAYFAEGQALGKVLRGTDRDYEITLVFADQPDTTHLKYDVLQAKPPAVADEVYAIDMAKGEAVLTDTDYTYVVMPEGYDPDAFDAISTQYFERYLSEASERSDISIRYYLEPLRDVHYFSRAENDLPQGSVFSLLLYGALALIVLLVACANYINLATARFPLRRKEAGVRKIMGAGPRGIVTQFIGESVFFALLAFPLALLIVALMQEHLPLQELLGSVLPLAALLKPLWLGVMLAFALIIGVLSGLYPAYCLMRVSVVNARSQSTSGSQTKNVRESLILLQLVVSISVIACTLLMYRQMHFLEEIPLGFDSANRIVVPVKGPAYIDRMGALLTELGQHSAFAGVAYSEGMPGNVTKEVSNSLESEVGEARRLFTARERIQGDYLKTLGITLVAGRAFGAEDYAVVDYDGSPDRKVLVNESLVRAMDWREPLGKKIGTYFVIGVVNDFRFQGLDKPAMPLVIQMDKPRWDRNTPDELAAQIRYLIVSVNGDTQVALDVLRTTWTRIYPELPFSFVMLDDLLARNQPSGEQLLVTIGSFGSICIIMASLGLFAMTAFTTEQRSKEIGIRKVMGASLNQIVLLLFHNIAKLVLIGGIIASVLSWWIVGKWLQGFYYQQSISLFVFFLATACMALIAFLTHLIQVFRINSIRPVQVLRNE